MSTTVRTRRITVALAAALLALGMVFVLNASSASAQAVNCQYNPNLPQCDNGGNGPGNGGGNNHPGNDNGGEGGNPATGAIGGSDNGTLPFTGYPLSPLVLVLLILLIAGFTVRAYLAVRDKLASERA